jgi:hypothetical protein
MLEKLEVEYIFARKDLLFILNYGLNFIV